MLSSKSDYLLDMSYIFAHFLVFNNIYHKYSFWKVQAVVQYFLDKNMRILLVCADSMKPSYLTPAKTVEKPSAIRFRKIMEYLNEKCTLYFSESR